ncbi:hypothetical protein JCM6882_001078 [Rhodosporidiobolus microsporus]
MRPSLSLLPALAALAALPTASTAASQSPLSSPATAVETEPVHQHRFSLFAAAEAVAVPDAAKRVVKRLRTAPPSLERWMLSRGSDEAAVEVEDGDEADEEADHPHLSEEEERRLEEEEERAMWRDLLGSLSKTGEVSPLFRELVHDVEHEGDGGVKEGEKREREGQVVFSVPDFPFETAPDSLPSSSSVSSSAPSLAQPETPHVAPPPSLLPPPTIPDAAEYRVPSHSNSHTLPYSSPPLEKVSVPRKARLVVSATIEGLFSLLRASPLPLPLSFSLSQNSSLALPLRPSLSLAAAALPRPLQTLRGSLPPLPMQLPPSLGLSFAAPAGMGVSK